jgi:diguanylate cyclase (GGDEF)-like protein
MNEIFKITRSALSKLKNLRSIKIIASVPPELEEQFDQLQLKNSLSRVRYLAIAILVFRLITMIIFYISNGSIIRSGRLAQLIYSEHKILYPIDTYNFALIILLFLLIAYFSKKDRRLPLWLTCYFFIILNFASDFLAMFFVESDNQIIYLFSTTLFLNMFIPDFKPKIFIWSAVLFYLATTGIIIYRFSFFYGGGTELIIADTFIAVLVIKILHYNSNVSIFLNLAKINALNEKLTILSTTDELTKLNNRRYFWNYMDIIWKQSRRLHLPLSLLMIDIDYFKKYNDSMGHLEGDKVLIAIAQCMKKQLKRETDFIARYGGEEFVCLLPYTEKENAFNFAKKMVQSVEDMKIHHPESESSKYVTISTGIVSTVPDEHNSLTQLLDEADKALYKAKNSGRNRVAAN